MAHSNSSINTYSDCESRYYHQYVLHSPKCKPDSVHLRFGVIAHDVLHKAGDLRDSSDVVKMSDYNSIIPDNNTNTDLLDEFGLSSWDKYFKPVIKETAKCEVQLEELISTYSQEKEIAIEREVKLSISPEQLGRGIFQPLVGVVDLLIRTKDFAIIMDYKFSTKAKTQDNYDLDSQLPLYAYLVHKTYNIALSNIIYGYIDIPKSEFGTPLLLKNGTLSRSKEQNITQETYEIAIKAIHGDDPVYNCKPGGHYYDCWCNLANKKAAYMGYQFADIEEVYAVVNDILDTAQVIDSKISNKEKFLKKFDAYSCADCQYLPCCKKWVSRDDM